MTVATTKSKTPPAIVQEVTNPKPPQRILIIGGGYAGFYTAWKLEKLLGLGLETAGFRSGGGLVLLFAHGTPPFRDAPEMGMGRRAFKGLRNINRQKTAP